MSQLCVYVSFNERMHETKCSLQEAKNGEKNVNKFDKVNGSEINNRLRYFESESGKAQLQRRVS